MTLYSNSRNKSSFACLKLKIDAADINLVSISIGQSTNKVIKMKRKNKQKTRIDAIERREPRERKQNNSRQNTNGKRNNETNRKKKFILK